MIGILVNIIGCVSFINKFTDHKTENVISAIIIYYIPIIVSMMEIYLNNKFPKEKSAISFSIILMTVFITVCFVCVIALKFSKHQLLALYHRYTSQSSVGVYDLKEFEC